MNSGGYRKTRMKCGSVKKIKIVAARSLFLKMINGHKIDGKVF
jgi:hypothetical protein